MNEGERMTELKSCPFCGKNPQGPYHDDLGTDDDYYVIRCPGCQLMMYDEYPDYVVKNWNRRAKE